MSEMHRSYESYEPGHVARLARDLLNVEPTLQPRGLAGRVLGELPLDQYEAALREVLPQWLRQTVYGNHGLAGRDPGGETQYCPDTHRPGGSPPGSSYSSRWANVSTALRRSFHGVDGWKPLLDFTVADVEFAARERRTTAKAIEAAADRFDAVLELLHTHGVERVGDLPTEARGRVEELFT